VAHQSDSEPQRRAEEQIRATLSDQLQVALTKRSFSLGEKSTVEVDAVDGNEMIFAEIYAHQGKLKGGHRQKIRSDVLKLITLARIHRSPRMLLVFADEVAAGFARGRSWLAEVIRTWDIEVRVVELDDKTRNELRRAQIRQEMINPSLGDATDAESVGGGADD
jgi:hypothetical protein